MKIEYKINKPLMVNQYIDILQRSSLAGRRPVDNRTCIRGMLNNSNLVISAWDGDKLVGIARSVTDYHFACYLSDLAVDHDYRQQGIGSHLQSLTRKQLGKQCQLMLLASADVSGYLEHVGFRQNPNCWILEPQPQLAVEQPSHARAH